MLNSTAIGTPTFTSKHSTEPNWNQKSFQKKNHILSNLIELLFQVTPIWKLKKLQKSLGHIIIAKGKRGTERALIPFCMVMQRLQYQNLFQNLNFGLGFQIILFSAKQETNFKFIMTMIKLKICMRKHGTHHQNRKF